MALSPSRIDVERPGKTSGWTALRSTSKYDGLAERPAGRVGVGTLDNVRNAFWQAYRHLFPPHALAAQTPSGGIVISWSVLDEPDASSPYAAPVVLRFDESLVDSMWQADARQRLRIATQHESEVRAGLRGYDPFARLPNARIVTLG